MANDKPLRRFRSSIISDGLIRATTRSFLYGLGLDDEDIARSAAVFRRDG